MKVVNSNVGCWGGEWELEVRSSLPKRGKNILFEQNLYLYNTRKWASSFQKGSPLFSGEKWELGKVHAERRWSVKSVEVFRYATALRGPRFEEMPEYLSILGVNLLVGPWDSIF